MASSRASQDIRARNVKVFTDTYTQTISRFPYQNTHESINGVPSTNLPKFTDRAFRIHVTKNDCVKDIPPDQKGILVNSASLKHAGGGVRNGSEAQEENLCRRSNMYMGLEGIEKHLHFPLHNKTCGILLPDVTFFKEGADRQYMMLEEPFKTDVVLLFSRPKNVFDDADDAASFHPTKSVDACMDHHFAAFRSLIYFANKTKATYLVVPPIGSGVFRNDPHTVAKALMLALATYQLETVRDIYISCYTSTANYDAYTSVTE